PNHSELVRWREGLRRTTYDYVLVDGPTDTSAAGLTQIAVLSDIVVVCFVPRRATIEAASRIAREIVRSTLTDIRILPVPTQFDDRDQARAAHTRLLVRRAFEDLLASEGQPASDPAEIPYH